MVEPGDHRIGDAERQQAIDLLRAHTGAGRLTLDEFGDLAAQVYAAQTYRELEAVADNLPPGLLPEPPPASAAPPPPPLPPPTPGTAARQGATHRNFIAIMSGSNARGRWRVPARISAFAFWGGVVIDMREAEFESQVVEISAWAIMGGVTVIVNEGVAVDVDGIVIMGGVNHPRAVDVTPSSPVVRVHARGLWGAVSAVVKRPSRKRRSRRDRSRSGWSHPDWSHGGWGRPPGSSTTSDGSPTGEGDTSDAETAGGGARSDRDRGRWPYEPPLELPQRILDEVAEALARIPGPGSPGRPGRARVPSRHRGGPGWRDAPDVPVPPSPPPSPSSPAADAIDVPVPPSPAADANDVPVPPSPRASPGRQTGTVADDVDARRNGDGPSGTLTMMVTDIVDSTAYAERLGDRRWIEVLREHNVLVRDQVARYGGTEVKAQGDGFLVVFPSARRAILAAVEVQRALVLYRDDNPDTPVEVRVGLHTGEIVDVDGDVFGQNVVVAVRITDHAAPGEIVVSGLTRDLTVSGGDLAFGPADEVELKGLSEPWRIHRVTWSHAPA